MRRIGTVVYERIDHHRGSYYCSVTSGGPA